MSSLIESSQANKKRYRAEKRFKFYGFAALLLSLGFLIFFFTDIVSKSYTAFMQTEIKTKITYTKETVEIPPLAVNEEVRDFVSHGFVRIIPSQVENNPDLMGKTVTRWVVAKDSVDQYIKGQPNGLSSSDKQKIDKLKKAGKIELAFNKYFFINGDSKLPEISGIFSAAVGTLYVIILTVLFSVPIGVMSAIYLEEYAPDNMLTRSIEVNINNLAAIPSILFGLLGLAVFINFFGVPRSSALAGGLTLSLMTLPVIIISTRASLQAVPDSIRHGALAVGASKWQMIWHHILPVSVPGILTGTILGVARAMGETAPLLLVGMMAYIPEAPDSFTDAATVLPAQIYTWASASQRAYVERTAAAIIVLLAILLTLNAAAIWLRNKNEKKW
ncbi:phosphate ABC transporter, inner membrane subunit PstA [Flexistipes sinusarabici DSM 4947]|uniref:Phosphate transport system permease protein PstA n=1 Tax=Flexistipes sinusarabici (strain ATCC 49648 / DSM 4947 / MAS 10) TaxID=717231 RepID=F8E3T2_FLESM|nr:phosphate ABC transporter permease PstA [Flexistipes sinusarabici]AEI15434.1 phosphate ABC transporter, inner membrane subunit PstA [Flexistipes sinusarabici DSM 4947]